MGQDENKNITPNPRATFTSGNRLGMRPSRNFDAMNELNRISADSTVGAQNVPPAQNDSIVLSGSSKKTNDGKKFIIISLIILVFAALVGGALLVTMGQNQGSGIFASEYTKVYNEYVEYLLNGKISEDKSNVVTLEQAEKSDDRVYPLTFKNLDSITHSKRPEIEAYFSEVKTRFSNLKTKADASNADLQNNLSLNEDVLDILDKTVNYPKYVGELIEKYNSSVNDTKKYLESTFNYSGDDEILKTLSERQKDFYASYVGEYAVFAQLGCYKGGTYNYDCIVMQGNDAVQSASSAEYLVSENYNRLYSSDILKVLNDKVLTVTKEISGK